MTTVLLWLAAYSIIGCASKPILPERPIIAVCVADGEGGAMCHNPRNGALKPKEGDIAGFVCFEPNDYQTDEEWILKILEVQRGI